MPKTALILTVFDRPEVFEYTLKCLSKQTTRDFDIHVCNNSDEPADFWLAKLAKWGTRLRVKYDVYDMGNKYSIWGRHVLIRSIAEQYENIVILDDDEMFNPDFMQKAIQCAEPGVVKSFWAWECGEDYYDRKRLLKNKTGNYAGTGGLVAKSELWLLSEMDMPPKEYWIIDDLWLSYVALTNGYKIRNLEVPITFVRQANGTFHNIKGLKSRFYQDYIKPFYW
jgi:glycosyltransferase involved in cell wall biosynthesis